MPIPTGPQSGGRYGHRLPDRSPAAILSAETTGRLAQRGILQHAFYRDATDVEGQKTET
jgi:hypothetical protein